MKARGLGVRIGVTAELGVMLLGLIACDARAASGTASGGSPTATLSASASLDFVVNIGKFVYLRVGSASGTIDTVSFAVKASIPAAGTTPTTTANSASVDWNGAAPSFYAVGTNYVVPVEVRSNAGQISVAATVTSALASGPNTIPLSEITVTSSDPDLPAPAIPNAGTGAAVNVTGTDFSNTVTVRSADWTFAYNPATVPPPGTYSGQVSFTVTSP